MAEEINMEKAQKVFDSLTRMLDNRDWKYEKHEEDLLIKSRITGDDLPIDFFVRVIPRAEVIQLVAPMPFHMPEDKRVDGAIAVCFANYGLINGSFDYDIRDGEIAFRLTTSYRATDLADDLLEDMIFVAASTSDNYNDRFFMLAKGMITIQEFIQKDQAE